MATVTKVVSSFTYTGTTIGGVSNLQAVDSNKVTSYAPNTLQYTYPAFTTSDIPSGATINSVTGRIYYHSDWNGITCKLQLLRNGVAIGTEASELSYNNTFQPFAVTVNSGISASDLATSGYIKLQNIFQEYQTDISHIDYVVLEVNYTPPATHIYSSINGSSSVTSSGRLKIKLSASIGATTDLSAILRAKAILIAQINGSSSITGVLGSRIKITAIISGSSALTASLLANLGLRATITSTSTLIGSLRGKGRLVTQIEGNSVLSLLINSKILIGSTIEGNSTVIGSLLLKARVVALINGSSSITARYTAEARIKAIIRGSSYVRAIPYSDLTFLNRFITGDSDFTVLIDLQSDMSSLVEHTFDFDTRLEGESNFYNLIPVDFEFTIT